MVGEGGSFEDSCARGSLKDLRVLRRAINARCRALRFSGL